jgi:hypothetical protein
MKLYRTNSALLAAFLACAFACGCWESCDYAILSETKSPDDKLKAVVFQRGCGANPIDSSMQISILGSTASSPSGRGNAFITGDENHTIPASDRKSRQIKVIWESNSSLVILYPKNEQVFLKKSSVAGVVVRYETVP